ncbi:MAG: phosphatase PAP2-related protein [Candidatus Nomurabacteria bacterium]
MKMKIFWLYIKKYYNTRLRSYYTDANFLTLSIIGFIFLKISFFVTEPFSWLATLHASNTVTDSVTDYIPYIDTSFIHITVSNLVYYFRLAIPFIFPELLPFSLFTTGVLICLRDITINLTHIGPPAMYTTFSSSVMTGGDLFFSGHVANVFLFGLIFYKHKILRNMFFVLSFVFAISAVVGRYHYSIDVVAAPFFAYGVFSFMKKILPVEYSMRKKK